MWLLLLFVKQGANQREERFFYSFAVILNAASSRRSDAHLHYHYPTLSYSLEHTR